MNKDKFQILRDFANSSNKPDKTIYEYIKEVLDMNSDYAKENKELKIQVSSREEVANEYKEVIDKAIEYIESKNNGHCIINGEEKGAFTFVLDFDEAREFIWELLDILKEVK